MDHEIIVPVDHVIAIYARENGQGMAFPMPVEAGGQGAPHGVGSATVITPPRGTVVKLTIDNYELSDQPLSRRTTFGRWSFTFRMP